MDKGLRKSDKIVKDHSKYTHTIVMEYPHSNVQNMKTSWRKSLEEGAVWLEGYQERLDSALKVGFEKLEEEQANAQKEIESQLTTSEEELFKAFKEARTEHLKNLNEFVKELDKRKAEFENAIKVELEQVKKQLMEKLQQKKEALKLWADK